MEERAIAIRDEHHRPGDRTLVEPRLHDVGKLGGANTAACRNRDGERHECSGSDRASEAATAVRHFHLFQSERRSARSQLGDASGE